MDAADGLICPAIRVGFRRGHTADGKGHCGSAIETIRCPGGALSSLIKTELFELSGKCLNLCVVEGLWHALPSGNPLISALPRPILGD